MEIVHPSGSRHYRAGSVFDDVPGGVSIAFLMKGLICFAFDIAKNAAQDILSREGFLILICQVLSVEPGGVI